MVAQAETQETGFYRISYKEITGYLAAFVVLVGGILYNLLIDDTRIRVAELETRIRIQQRTIDTIKNDDQRCTARNNRQQGAIEALESWRDLHMKFANTAQQETARWRAGVNKDIETVEQHMSKEWYYRR